MFNSRGPSVCIERETERERERDGEGGRERATARKRKRKRQRRSECVRACWIDGKHDGAVDEVIGGARCTDDPRACGAVYRAAREEGVQQRRRRRGEGRDDEGGQEGETTEVHAAGRLGVRRGRKPQILYTFQQYSGGALSRSIAVAVRPHRFRFRVDCGV